MIATSERCRILSTVAITILDRPDIIRSTIVRYSSYYFIAMIVFFFSVLVFYFQCFLAEIQMYFLSFSVRESGAMYKSSDGISNVERRVNSIFKYSPAHVGEIRII